MGGAYRCDNRLGLLHQQSPRIAFLLKVDQSADDAAAAGCAGKGTSRPSHGPATPSTLLLSGAALDREKYICRVTLTGGAVNLLLVIFKFVAGILGHSSAMVADAAHSLSDFASDVIVLLCLRVAGKPEDEDHAYGHGKFETLASVAIGLLLLATGCGLFWDGAGAIAAFARGEMLMAPAWLAFAAAVISILVKEGLYHYTMAAARKMDSGTLKANAWHHRSDALSSIATVIGIGGAMLPGEGWRILDPLAACVISIFIVVMAFSLMKPAIDELMEKSLPETEKEQIEQIIASTEGVLGFHRLRTRRMGVNRAVEAHIKMDGSLSLREGHDIATRIEKRLKERLGDKTHVGLHMEPASIRNGQEGRGGPSKQVRPDGVEYPADEGEYHPQAADKDGLEPDSHYLP